MTQQDFFKHAKWVYDSEKKSTDFSVLRGTFFANDIVSANINVLGLGFFKCYINGKCINPDTFLPLSSEFDNSCDPEGEVFSGHRIYVPAFDITPFVKNGVNTIAIHYGGGWYTHPSRTFGVPKAIYLISLQTLTENIEFVSGENCKVGKSYVESCNFIQYETHNYLDFPDCFSPEFDDSSWKNANIAPPLDTNYFSTNCPADKLISTLPVKEVSPNVYDCGENTVGYPVIEVNAECGEKVTVRFSEELLPNGKLDMAHSHLQEYQVVSNGKALVVQPEFTWFGFRFFEVTPNAKPLCVKVVYAGVDVNSSFECDNETLNWIYKTFIHTMLCNMHIGHPSDCPHIERRGYTGDGQLTCNAVLTMLDARNFYEKWLCDIADSQDKLSGHIQYTAPYILSGGGPGGWGCAIVEVPYRLYKHYAKKETLEKYYPNMRRYVDYLEAHSEFGLVTSDKKGVWCLGDWCGPNILYPDKDITFCDQQVMLPAPFVNTYFMVKSLEKMCEIAKIIGKDEDIAEYEEKIKMRKRAIQAAYFNTFDSSFVMNVQGANAYAVDLGLGDEKTYDKMVEYYQKLGHLDTGIFATDILIRTLFENGDAHLALKLLCSTGNQGFEHWRQNGATTFHEYWDSNRSRSHNHPMFGAAVVYFFEYLLGIKQTENSAGYTSLVIKPECVSEFNRMKGHIATTCGKVEVSYTKSNDCVCFRIVIPQKTEAVLEYLSKKYPLTEGENIIKIYPDENNKKCLQ